MGADLTAIAKDIGFRYHSTIVWNEGNISRRTAWGSWMSASAPYVIAPVELIVVLYREQLEAHLGNAAVRHHPPGVHGLDQRPVDVQRREQEAHGPPCARFRVELPRRCIRLFSFVGDTVLDPFMGSGTTLLAAGGRRAEAIGIEIERRYCALARKRIRGRA